ncbi:uncharacterized protein G6M90_00g047770 [Metarhizium brunneum]|uniref:Uncharacterized protein n=1 Tax=Metarhizium brunneum TaxID=500148 RepID=A0A7D5YS90_9HYPO|nr:hypothetical protein G6M90_00g047770 [Metarhizium brunneum]
MSRTLECGREGVFGDKDMILRVQFLDKTQGYASDILSLD